MSRKPISNLERSEDYGALQRVVDALFKESDFASRLDVVIMAESFDLPSDLL